MEVRQFFEDFFYHFVQFFLEAAIVAHNFNTILEYDGAFKERIFNITTTMKEFCIMAILAAAAVTGCQQNKAKTIDEKTVSSSIEALVEKYGESQRSKIEKGVSQCARLWEVEDGYADEFHRFVLENYIDNDSLRQRVFERIAMQLEGIYGGFNQMSVSLQEPLHVSDYEISIVDGMFAQWDPSAHWQADFFDNKTAFFVILNFPFYRLEEKNQSGAQWTDLEWGYARLGDIFTSRVPAKLLQQFARQTTAADHYISNYNIYMGKLVDSQFNACFPEDMALITHWGLRDEIKSQYADTQNGLKKQQMIYQVMKRIIHQDIPQEVINQNQYQWNPYSNTLYAADRQVASSTPEPFTRYSHLLNIYRAAREIDPYTPHYPTYMFRKFEEEIEIPQTEIEKLFIQLLESKQVQETARLIAARLGRNLQPFDIWYDGFKARSNMDPQFLDSICMQKYPDKKHFSEGLPEIMEQLGFTAQQAQSVCSHITVDASRGAGHAWESAMKTGNARLRTRITDKGMDYKGYNIGVHEFGHNVEQTITLHNVPNYLLRGVPNTAFTEAYAFVFQKRDLDLLGIKNQDMHASDLTTLDIFWGCYEIMGVSLVDIRVWDWMYQHPKENPEELKNAVMQIATDVWNTYYAPVFGVKDEPILAIYSHMIDAPLYLSGYPLGHLIEFQYERYFEGKNIGRETYRLFSKGRLTPQCWLKKGLQTSLSIEPLLNATQKAVENLSRK
jgi:hypothetical protein